ncbi:hypothetical protein TNCV_3242141 [Trichonephila clavipes]|nr:hypothetical protein TNCV_3242141 [Trichonephila clavipes]
MGEIYLRLVFAFDELLDGRDSTNYLGEIHRRDDRWRYHLSPPPQFRHGTEGEGSILQSPALVFQPTSLSDPLMQRARTPCVSIRRIFGGIGH